MASHTGHNGSEGRTFGVNHQPCRTCTDFKTWSRLQKEAMHTKSQEVSKNPTGDNDAKVHGCPLDKDELGRSTWGVLHTIAAQYPEKPSTKEKEGMKQFFSLISQFYPCEHCAEDFRKDLKAFPPKVESYEELSQWLCRAHNRVNRKLGKPEFDCKLVSQRWRDGWKDGSCD